MEEVKKDKGFPNCFPTDFREKILPKGAAEQKLEVYRVCKWGRIERQAFLSTYEETELGLRPPKRGDNKAIEKWRNNPGTYSTSCNVEYYEACRVLDLFMRNYPEPIISKGEIQPDLGPSQLTKERGGEDNSHVDWWIYKDTEPHMSFEEVESDEK